MIGGVRNLERRGSVKKTDALDTVERAAVPEAEAGHGKPSAYPRRPCHSSKRKKRKERKIKDKYSKGI